MVLGISKLTKKLGKFFGRRKTNKNNKTTEQPSAPSAPSAPSVEPITQDTSIEQVTVVTLDDTLGQLKTEQLLQIYNNIEELYIKIEIDNVNNINNVAEYYYKTGELLYELLYNDSMENIFYTKLYNGNKKLENNGKKLGNFLAQELDYFDITKPHLITETKFGKTIEKTTTNFKKLIQTIMLINEYINKKIPEDIKKQKQKEVLNRYDQLINAYKTENNLLKKQKLFKELQKLQKACSELQIKCDMPEEFANLPENIIQELIKDYNRSKNNIEKQAIINRIAELCKGNENDKDCKKAPTQKDLNEVKLREQLDEYLHMANDPEKIINARSQIDKLFTNTSNDTLKNNITKALKNINNKAPQVLEALKRKLTTSANEANKKIIQKKIDILLQKYPNLVTVEPTYVTVEPKHAHKHEPAYASIEKLKKTKIPAIQYEPEYYKLKKGTQTLKQTLLKRDINKCLKKLIINNNNQQLINFKEKINKTLETIQKYVLEKNIINNNQLILFYNTCNNILTHIFKFISQLEINKKNENKLLFCFYMLFKNNLKYISITNDKIVFDINKLTHILYKLKTNEEQRQYPDKIMNKFKYLLETIKEQIENLLHENKTQSASSTQISRGPLPPPPSSPAPAPPPSTPPSTPPRRKSSAVYAVPGLWESNTIYANPRNVPISSNASNIYEEVGRSSSSVSPQSQRSRQSRRSTRKNSRNSQPKQALNPGNVVYAVPTPSSQRVKSSNPNEHIYGDIETQSPPQPPPLPPRKKNIIQ